jgi:hypothetical protein
MPSLNKTAKKEGSSLLSGHGGCRLPRNDQRRNPLIPLPYL